MEQDFLNRFDLVLLFCLTPLKHCRDVFLHLRHASVIWSPRRVCLVHPQTIGHRKRGTAEWVHSPELSASFLIIDRAGPELDYIGDCRATDSRSVAMAVQGDMTNWLHRRRKVGRVEYREGADWHSLENL